MQLKRSKSKIERVAQVHLSGSRNSQYHQYRWNIVQMTIRTIIGNEQLISEVNIVWVSIVMWSVTTLDPPFLINNLWTNESLNQYFTTAYYTNHNLFICIHWSDCVKSTISFSNWQFMGLQILINMIGQFKLPSWIHVR